MPRRAAARRAAEAEFDAMAPTALFLADEESVTQGFREALQSPALDIDLDPDRFRETTAAMGLDFLDRLFLSDKSRAMAELGILDDQGKWREEVFQKFLHLLQEAEKRKINPSIEAMRLWTNDLVDLDGRLRRRALPFDWMLRDDRLSNSQRDEARAIASLMLKRRPRDKVHGIGDAIAAKDIRYIEQVCRWFTPHDARHEVQNLDGLAVMVQTGACGPAPIINLEQPVDRKKLAKAIAFVNRHIRKSPDYELLCDYMKGYVGLSGRGMYRS